MAFRTWKAIAFDVSADCRNLSAEHLYWDCDRSQSSILDASIMEVTAATENEVAMVTSTPALEQSKAFSLVAVNELLA
jgi:hypothetical protein